MANLIRQISRVITPQGGTQTTMSYPIGALGSNIEFDSSQDFKTNKYLPYFNTEESIVASTADSLAKVNQNIINKLSEVDERENTNNRFLDNSIKNLTSTVSSINRSLNNTTNIVDSHTLYLQSLVNNTSARLDLADPWGQNIYLNSVVAASNSGSSASMAAGNNLGQLAGKLNYIRQNPFIIIRYRKKNLGLSAGLNTFSWSLTSTADILEIETNTASVTKNNIKLSDYNFIFPSFPEIYVGAHEAMPTRGYIDNNKVYAVYYAPKSITANASYTVNIRILAVLK